MILAFPQLPAAASLWGDAQLRAAVQGSVALLVVWAACAVLPRLPAPARCGLWRLAYAKLLVALFWVTPVDLPLLPAPAQSHALAAAIVEARPLGPEPADTHAPTQPNSPSPTLPYTGILLALWLVG